LFEDGSFQLAGAFEGGEMEGFKGHVQRRLEVVDQFIGHLRDVLLEAVGRIEGDRAYLAEAF
jgi:hypothetical protein